MFERLGKTSNAVAVICLVVFFLSLFCMNEPLIILSFIAIAIFGIASSLFTSLHEHLSDHEQGGSSIEDDQTVICPYCGKFIGRSDKYCKFCGRHFGS